MGFNYFLTMRNYCGTISELLPAGPVPGYHGGNMPTQAKNPLRSHRFDARRANALANKLEGHSLAEIGRKIGLTRFEVCKIFKGTRSPSFPTCYQFAAAYGCTIDDVVNYIAYRVQESNPAQAA